MALLLAAVLSSPWWLAGRQLLPQQVYGVGLIFSLVMVLSMGTLGMYQHSQTRADMRSTLLRILPALVLAFCLQNLLTSMLPRSYLGHPGAGVFLLGGLAVLGTRLLVFTSAQSRLLEQRLIVVGQGATARECMELAAAGIGFHPFKVLGFVPVQGEDSCVPSAMLLPADSSLLALARRHGADEIIVSVGDRRGGGLPVHQLLDCALGGVPVTDAATFFEREACQIRLDALQPSYLIFGGGFKQNLFRAMVKRGVDLCASALIGLLTAPVMALAAIAIWLEDGGSVFYQQERIGRNNRPFRVLKFRSMRLDAERDGQPRWALENDPRITRVGYWLRRLRIDELPQMLNVLKGEMSFVGPRPERAYFVNHLNDLTEYYNVRHSIKPGITGLAQVRYRYGASMEDALSMVAEAAKVIENTQRDLNIALMNELAIIFDRLQIDTREVLQAAGTKWNFLPFQPGLVGGHCIGVDPYYLTHKAQKLGYHPDVILAGRRINDSMAKFIAERTVKLMVQANLRIKGAMVIVLGLTFKENCPDLRNSKVADLITELQAYGLEVVVHDPVADPEEAAHEYGVRLLRWNELPVADALICAVPHRSLLQRPMEELCSRVRSDGCLIDLKGQYSLAALQGSGRHIWRL
ncbi:TIGR03013 family XrtA/PEP-CTERM system glycosyltransferase [Pseudoduganella danionis]|uniref:TIGR03013 family PEP-CTERM/XrtA system glycosyltransferase n=1 Tax=Pseudoduganella danionis TaxID=1890295 RepID=A0ABW9SVD9_9BURK|nr:TIGR03013 family XrtA/PEP-CTERM system glycosyltransferase [Pseudoduganella danionis]MTW34644.1 TIGR03013 family PEP-CTERM/XrtA system glycosyltransferase [Pseudoduganella danionis]